MDILEQEGEPIDAMRLRAFPFSEDVKEFVDAHETIYVIEQNRDAQCRSLLILELGIDPAKLKSILNYDGMPITADAILKQLRKQLNGSAYTATSPGEQTTATMNKHKSSIL
jgi:2-oxoglutarate ferredoxin oxidoreductase subunit alpha